MTDQHCIALCAALLMSGGIEDSEEEASKQAARLFIRAEMELKKIAERRRSGE